MLAYSGWFLFAANVFWVCQLARWWRTLRQYQKTLDEQHKLLDRWTQDMHRLSTASPEEMAWAASLRFSDINTRIISAPNGKKFDA